MSSPKLATFLIVAVALLLGVLCGIGVFTFGYGDGLAYLSNNPAACANCHVMELHYDSWQKSSHHTVAQCNDCHTPHHPIMKWVTKADNGFFHSLAFTLDNFHEPIQIKARNRRVTLGTCESCHADVIHQMAGGNEINCVHCHADVGHGLK